ncbi:MAG TPA: class I SAM-dependent methyltransferase [Verrucomicrobiae bacterium]
MTDSLAADYAAKNADYYGLCRPEMLRFVPASAKRILEVGCGAGEFCAQFRRSAECELWGVEPNRDAALKAKEKLDNVFCSYFDESVELPSEYFDCIIFNDVLEHIYDGLSALKLTRKLLRNGGSVVASIPNIGHFPTIWRLVVRGQWEYTDKGILDKTHVRFFTRQSVQTLFEKAGFNIQRLDGINSFFSMEPEDGRLWHFYRMISWVPAKGIIDMRHLQFGVLAVK